MSKVNIIDYVYLNIYKEKLDILWMYSAVLKIKRLGL